MRLGDPTVGLSSFIISNTPSHVMKLHWAMDKSAMEARHILFQEEDKGHIRAEQCSSSPWRHRRGALGVVSLRPWTISFTMAKPNHMGSTKMSECRARSRKADSAHTIDKTL